MKLLLHGCCADCTLKFIESIKSENIELNNNFAIYYYNPNIHPRSEYVSRLQAIQKITREAGVKLIIPDWQPSKYFGAVKDRQGRCPMCWKLRISETAEYARANGYSHFSTTLITSQYQNSDIVRQIASKTAADKGIGFFEPKTVCKELKTCGFYKQFFCGCVYSLQERFEEKYSGVKTDF